MWILIVMQVMAGSATSHSSYPTPYAGVVMQEFSSEKSCQSARKRIQAMKQEVEARNGILKMECVAK